MNQQPSGSTGDRPPSSRGAGPPRSRPRGGGGPAQAHDNPEPRQLHSGTPRSTARSANSLLSAQHGSIDQSRVHRRAPPRSQAQQSQRRPRRLRPNSSSSRPNRDTRLSRPLLPANARPPVTPIPTPAAGRNLGSRRYQINPDHEREFYVESFSVTAGRMVELRVVLTDLYQLSVAYPFVAATLGLAPMILPPGAFGSHRLSPIRRFMPRRFIGLSITQLSLEIHNAELLSLVFDDDVPDCGVDIFLGWEFMNRHLRGQLPPLLPRQLASGTLRAQGVFMEGS